MNKADMDKSFTHVRPEPKTNPPTSRPMNKKSFIREPRPVTTGTFKADEYTFDLIHDVLSSGRISYGEKSKYFESWFAELHDVKYAILSNSGTSSLHIALQALKELHGWKDGDEVIVPASTFVATINIVIHNNMKPVFVDIEPITYGINPELIEQYITPRTKAIIPVHLYGQPCRMTEILTLATIFDLAIIEDSCEAMFVSHNGAKVGSMGQIGCFSTYNAHLITTGVGGISTTSNEDYAKKMRSLVNHGLDIAELNTDENFSPRPVVGRSFRFTSSGHSYRITEFEAALGLAQLQVHKDMLKTRRRNANHLSASLKIVNKEFDDPFLIPMTLDGNEHSWMMYPIVVRGSKIVKPDLTKYLNDHLIETRDMMPVVNQPIYSDYALRRIDYPTAWYINDYGFYIGCHQDITPDDIEYVKQTFIEFMRL